MARVLKEVSVISGTFGQDGEERIAKILADSLPDNYLLLNSPRIAYRENIVDIDHIVITPSAIFIIESKNMNGKITGGLMGNWVQERVVHGRIELVKIGNPASQVNQYAKIVRQYLKDAYLKAFDQPHNFKIEPVVVFAHDQSNITGMSYTHRGFIGKVRICKPRDLINFISSFTKEYHTTEEMQWCADILIPPEQRDQTGIFPSALITNVLRESFQGRFQILEEIGAGSFGTVFKGYDTKLDRAVAIKRLHHRKKSEDVVKRFNREARANAKLRHDHIVEFYDYYEENGDFYIVMELIDGKPLDEVMEGPIDLEELSDLFLDICSALQHAHDNGVIHRDLKTANIMITDNGKVKVTDFGVARIVGEEMLTGTHSSVGTPSIMAPEQIMGQEVDQRVDIFALGVLLYQMVTGKLPFTGDSIGEVVNNIMHSEPALPSNLNPQLPRSLDEVVIRALAKDPAERYSSATDLAAALCSALDPNTRDVGDHTSIKRAIKKLRKLLHDDRFKFQLIAVLTFGAFIWMFAAQSYKDARLLQDPNDILKANPGFTRSEIVTNSNLAQVHRAPKSYLGAKVHISGKLHRIVGQGKNSFLLVELSVPQENKPDLVTLVVFGGNPHTWMDKLEPNDLLHITGKLDKIEGLDFKPGIQPLVVADSIETMEPWAEMAPSLLTLNTNQIINRDGKVVILKRIELAGTETRLYITVQNRSGLGQRFSLANPVALQGDRNYKQLYKVEGNFEFNLQPGQSSEGIIYLEPLNLLLGEAKFKLGTNVANQEPFEFSIKWK